MNAEASLLSFGAGRKVYSVASLTAELKGLVEDKFPDVRVSGEISNAKMYRSGHWYFTLKDEDAQISCVCFRGSARFLTTKPADGLSVIARGRVSVYPQQGKYQLYVESLEPQGLGALQVRFDRLKAKLQTEGLFDADRKRQLPPMPSRIGLVTSPTGAVIADMLRIIERRFPGLHIRLFPVRVQGDGSAREIVDGIQYFSERAWAEVVIVGRGGGSLEDLWSFNEETVARAIAVSSVPVVSAVGHETDFTIADFVADLRAPTPSAAAELVVPQADGVRQAAGDAEARARKAMSFRIARLGNHLLRNGMDRVALTVQRRIGEAGQLLDDADQKLHAGQEGRLRAGRARLDLVDRKLGGLDLQLRLARQSAQLGSLSVRLEPAVRKALEARLSRMHALGASFDAVRRRLVRESDRLAAVAPRLRPSLKTVLDRKAFRLTSASGRLDALSPLAILKRGYSILQTDSGEAVREHRQVAAGDALSVRLHRGKLDVRVENTHPDGEFRPPAGSETV